MHALTLRHCAPSTLVKYRAPINHLTSDNSHSSLLVSLLTLRIGQWYRTDSCCVLVGPSRSQLDGAHTHMLLQTGNVLIEDLNLHLLNSAQSTVYEHMRVGTQQGIIDSSIVTAKRQQVPHI